MKKWIINNKKDIENEIIGIGSGGNINKIFSLSQKKRVRLFLLIPYIISLKK